MKNFTTKQLSLLPAFLFLFAAFLSSTMAYAQAEKEEASTSKVVIKSSDHSTMKKTVNVEDVNGEKVVTVTTITDGNKNVEVYKGQEAEDYIDQMAENSIKVITTEGFVIHPDDDHEGDIKVMIMESDFELDDEHKMVWVSDGDDLNINVENVNVEITEEDGVKTIQLNYTDEDGKQTEKIIVLDETEIVKSLEEMEQLLEDMDIDINMDISMDDNDGETVKTVIVTKKIIIEEDENFEDEDSEMFKEFEVSPNPSKGQIKLNFEPTNTGKVKVSILDIKGNVLYTDSYNGKSAYSKNISLDNYSGVVVLKIEQGNDVEIHKLIIE